MCISACLTLLNTAKPPRKEVLQEVLRKWLSNFGSVASLDHTTTEQQHQQQQQSLPQLPQAVNTEDSEQTTAKSTEDEDLAVLSNYCVCMYEYVLSLCNIEFG